MTAQDTADFAARAALERQAAAHMAAAETAKQAAEQAEALRKAMEAQR